MKTLKVRVKDRHAETLNKMAREVSFVWNYCNELSSRAIRERGLFLSGYDLAKYTAGSTKQGLEISAQTIQLVGYEYATRRKQFKKAKLKWRSARKSLGWVPFSGQKVKWKNGQVYYNGHYFKVFDSYGLSQYKFRSGSFNQDSRGRWYFNVCVDAKPELSNGQDVIGIDLGLKTTAVCSDGTELHASRFYRESQQQLAVAQRANKKQRVKAIHAKIANRRKDAQHKFSTELVKRCQAIYVGDVSASKLVRTSMAKSVYDAGWSQLKTMLEYKCNHAGIVFKVVNESYTTVTCSVCKNRTGPTGLGKLSVRHWTCDCGVSHNRDINAAKNIAAVGLDRPVEGNRFYGSQNCPGSL